MPTKTVGPYVSSALGKLSSLDAAAATSHADALSRILGAYDSWVVRVYVWGRFQILRQRFLDEIGQYLPSEGRVLDIGCGFGLFSIYYAVTRPGLRLHGFDIDVARINTASRVAAKLGLTNVAYTVRDARTSQVSEQFEAVYILDLIHHIPVGAAESLLRSVAASLQPGGVLLVKDVDTRPAYKRHFTRLLDALLDPHAAVSYWEAATLRAFLESLDLRVYSHMMLDVLPYPHVLFICYKK